MEGASQYKPPYSTKIEISPHASLLESVATGPLLSLVYFIKKRELRSIKNVIDQLSVEKV